MMGRVLGAMGASAGGAVPADGGLVLAVGALFWLVGAQVCIEADFRLGRVVLCWQELFRRTTTLYESFFEAAWRLETDPSGPTV